MRPPDTGLGRPPPVRWLGGDQPWRLVLSRPAKRLVTLFLVLGAVLAVGYVVLISVVAATSGNNSVTRAEATISVEELVRQAEQHALRLRLEGRGLPGQAQLRQQG